MVKEQSMPKISLLESLSFFSYWTRVPPAITEATQVVAELGTDPRSQLLSSVTDSIGSKEVGIGISARGFKFTVFLHS